MNVKRKENRKRGVSILLSLIMVLTTMMPAWAYGNEVSDASAVKQSSQETGGEAQAAPDEQQPAGEGAADPTVTDEPGSSTQGEASGSDEPGNTDTETAQYFAVISSDKTGADPKEDAPYI